jgi:hypothetical protein
MLLQVTKDVRLRTSGQEGEQVKRQWWFVICGLLRMLPVPWSVPRRSLLRHQPNDSRFC